MGMFTNLKINSLRKKIEGNYDSILDGPVLSLKNLPEPQKKELATMCALVLEAMGFAKAMNYLLFHTDVGVFRNDIGNLDEYKFDQLYRIMAICYTWIQVSFGPDGKKHSNNTDFCVDSLETCLGINPLVARTYFDGLMESSNPVVCVLYRWCMLAVGHIDNNWDTLHGNSPDCLLFIKTIDLAIEEKGKH